MGAEFPGEANTAGWSGDYISEAVDLRGSLPYNTVTSLLPLFP